LIGSTVTFFELALNFNTRLIVALILVVPLALLAWLGQRSLTQDRIVAEHQAIELADARLREAQTLVHSFIAELQQSAVTALSSLDIQGSVSGDNIALIRQVIDADPFLEHVFILNGERELLFPQDTIIHSNTERSFAESFTSVLNDENAFRAKPPSENSAAAISGNRRTKDALGPRASFNRVSNISKTIANVQQDVANKLETGWTTWDTGTTTDIYLWHRTSNDLLVGQKLSSAYWLSQLISRLPSGNDAGIFSDASIRLVDKRQRTIYQWGGYALSDPASGEVNPNPISKDWLTYPLDGWRLEYYAPVQAASSKLMLFVLLFLSLITLIGIGARVIWQEYRREMRNAEQRVSFVNQVSHELKTPLTNICIYADMLESEVTQDEVPDSQRVKKFTNVVTSESQRLGRLINNVLNFSRAQQQKISVHKSLISADEIIELTIGNFAPALAAKNIAIETELHAQKPVMLDSELLEQVLNNLISNIEKYAADGGLAHIKSELTKDIIIIQVCDAGRGIPQALREKIFEPFERGSNSLTEGVSGTGIGLSIARDLCRLHGGDLELINSDKGACFKVSLNSESAS